MPTTGPTTADQKIKENSESYVKSAYLADSLIALEHGDLSDLQTPARIRFTAKGRRGSTDLDSAVVAIRMGNLFDKLPEYFTTKKRRRTPTKRLTSPGNAPPIGRSSPSLRSGTIRSQLRWASKSGHCLRTKTRKWMS